MELISIGLAEAQKLPGFELTAEKTLGLQKVTGYCNLPNPGRYTGGVFYEKLSLNQVLLGEAFRFHRIRYTTDGEATSVTHIECRIGASAEIDFPIGRFVFIGYPEGQFSDDDAEQRIRSQLQSLLD